MKLNIEFTRRTAYADGRERDSISILCISREDGEQWFRDHYPASRGYEIESICDDGANGETCVYCGLDEPCPNRNTRGAHYHTD